SARRNVEARAERCSRTRSASSASRRAVARGSRSLGRRASAAIAAQSSGDWEASIGDAGREGGDRLPDSSFLRPAGVADHLVRRPKIRLGLSTPAETVAYFKPRVAAVSPTGWPSIATRQNASQRTGLTRHRTSSVGGYHYFGEMGARP